MSEIGFYSMGSFGGDPARVAAIARHLPAAVTYIYDRPAARRLMEYHGVAVEGITCQRGCADPGMAVQAWLRNRSPEVLVMDEYPYGCYRDESRRYIELRRSRQEPTVLLDRRSEHERPMSAADFALVIGTDETSPGTNLYPVLPFAPTEIMARADARAALGAGERPFVLMIGEGSTPDVNRFVRRHCQQAGIDCGVIAQYPVMPFMAGPDLIVGYVGYHQVEAAAVGAVMKGVANRTDPLQHWRVNTTPDDLAATIASLEVRAEWTIDFEDNSAEAANLIASLLPEGG